MTLKQLVEYCGNAGASASCPSQCRAPRGVARRSGLSLASDCRSVDAFSLYRDGRPFIFLNTAMSGERQRFDTAHELGHLVLHADADVAHGRDKEQEANRFAASLLMPARGLRARACEKRL